MVSGGDEVRARGIDFSIGLCEMKPGGAATINSDKNNPIQRLFDLSAFVDISFEGFNSSLY